MKTKRKMGFRHFSLFYYRKACKNKKIVVYILYTGIVDIPLIQVYARGGQHKLTVLTYILKKEEIR